MIFKILCYDQFGNPADTTPPGLRLKGAAEHRARELSKLPGVDYVELMGIEGVGSHIVFAQVFESGRRLRKRPPMMSHSI